MNLLAASTFAPAIDPLENTGFAVFSIMADMRGRDGRFGLFGIGILFENEPRRLTKLSRL
jgi:hypothetical protein